MQPNKTKLRLLSLIMVLCSLFATRAVFGQAITWIGPDAAFPGGANFGHTTNWSGGQPISDTLCVFDGTVPGNLLVYSWDGIDGSGALNPIGAEFGAGGIRIELTPSQTGSLNFICYTGVLASIVMGFNGFLVQSGAGQFVLGDNNPNQLTTTLRPSAGIHVWENDSTNPVVINPNFQIHFAGGTAHTLNFQGTGDFAITNNLRNNNKAPGGTVLWNNTGTTTWAAGGVNDRFNDSGLAGVVVNAGTVIAQGPNLLPSTTNFTIVNNGSLVVNGSNPTSSIVVNGGTLGGTGVLSTVTIQGGGTLAPGPGIGTLTLSNLVLGGNLAIEVNKSLVQSNDSVVVIGTLTNSGAGTVVVTNLGSALISGDKFTLFSQPLQNGAALTVTGAGVTWQNNLAVDGSISVVGVATPTLNFVPSGGNVQFSWSGNFKLEVQTNGANVGLGTNWMDYPGGATSPLSVPIDPTQGTVFFRLAPAP